jgi:hypothetical protein
MGIGSRTSQTSTPPWSSEKIKLEEEEEKKRKCTKY